MVFPFQCTRISYYKGHWELLKTSNRVWATLLKQQISLSCFETYSHPFINHRIHVLTSFDRRLRSDSSLIWLVFLLFHMHAYWIEDYEVQDAQYMSWLCTTANFELTIHWTCMPKAKHSLIWTGNHHLWRTCVFEFTCSLIMFDCN